MISTTELDPTEAAKGFSSEQKPRPLNSLTAAAARLKSTDLARVGNRGKAEAWQEDAWDMHDLVGEQRFLAHTLANRMSQARFFVGKLPKNTTEDIEPETEGPAYDTFQSLVGRGMNWSQIVQRLGINLFIPGDAYLVGTPEDDNGETVDADPDADGISPVGGRISEADVEVDKLVWTMHSVSEVKVDDTDKTVTIQSGGGTSVKHLVDNVVLIRVWRPHPRFWWEADSPTRSSLPVLRELVGLTMHISAQVDSRLAGAGMLLIPQEADQAVRAGIANYTAEESPIAAAIMEAMTTSISDRSNASALVPIMPVVPGDVIEKFRFMSFSSALDTEARSLREEAIRRLALGQDCPPELLLGVGSMNHWGAWLVREDVVTTHLEPPLALICDAITTQFLWPVLEQQDVPDFKDYVVWYDVDHLIQRPNRAQDAKDAKNLGLIKDATTRDALGFDESDAPEETVTDPAIQMAMDLVRQSPGLVANPGLPALVEQIRSTLDGTPGPEAPSTDEEPTDDQGSEDEDGDNEGNLPDTKDDPAPEPGAAPEDSE